ncbi:MAG: hypothetical protein WCO26_16505 [Deltaproteobacteria bacterium]
MVEITMKKEPEVFGATVDVQIPVALLLLADAIVYRSSDLTGYRKKRKERSGIFS